VTTEDDFQKELDACPSNHTLRLILADFLQERDDPRADGYRALGERQRVPRSPRERDEPSLWSWVKEENIWAWTGAFFGEGSLKPHALPDAWIAATRTSPDFDFWTNHGAGWRQWPTRRECEDAAALAFLEFRKKPPESVASTQIAG
jgi:uncharacterized protein (TIGR02996 family)